MQTKIIYCMFICNGNQEVDNFYKMRKCDNFCTSLKLDNKFNFRVKHDQFFFLAQPA